MESATTIRLVNIRTSLPTSFFPLRTMELSEQSQSTDCKVEQSNTSYSVTAETLTELFGQVGPVTDVQLITRYGRSKGYGFVTFAAPEHVSAAVSKFSQYELEGRQMNCENAREKKPIEKRLDDLNISDSKEEKKSKPTNPKKKRRAPRKPRSPKAVADSEDIAAPAAETSPSPAPAPEVTEKKPQRERKVRAPRSKDAPISETMVFIGNLPFEVTDSDLTTMFEKYGVVSARVVTGRYGRSKGFGFVDFKTHESQMQVLNDFTDAVVNERKLALKAAYEAEPKEQ